MHTTDEELVALAVDGSPDAFNQLVVRWERTIFALAYRVLGREEDARDVCQEAFLRAYRGIAKFKREAKFSSWLYRIALNLCRDLMRRQLRRGDLQATVDTQDLPQHALVDPISESAEDAIVRRDLGKAVARVMSTLPEEQRVVIVLKEFHELTFREIADLVGCPLSTVKTRYYQGLSTLRQRLSADGLGLTSLGASPLARSLRPSRAPAMDR